jgi:hypothetical protein
MSISEKSPYFGRNDFGESTNGWDCSGLDGWEGNLPFDGFGTPENLFSFPRTWLCCAT